MATFCAEMQGSKLAIAHGNQNVTWATWKRRKIAQLDINNIRYDERRGEFEI
jgi:hypothetical protein